MMHEDRLNGPIYCIAILYFGALGCKALSQARPDPGPKFGLGPGLRFFEAQALGSRAQARPEHH
jgi:hypothetical protein